MKLLKSSWFWAILWALAIAYGSFSCDVVGPLPFPTNTQTVNKGEHYPTFPIFRKVEAPDSLGWIVQFQTNCNYILRNPDGSISVDQQDWNKAVGEKFGTLDPHVNTAMLGFRYNVEAQKVEVNFYHHISGERDYTGVLHSFDLMEPFEYRIVPRYSDGTITETLWTIDGKLIRCIVFHFPQIKGKYRINAYDVNLYFGGNQKAPQRVTVYRRPIKYY